MLTRKDKRVFRNLLAKFLICAMVFTSVFTFNTYNVEAAAKNPVISKNKRDILVGDTYNLNIKNKVKDSTYKWTSSNKNVATVNKRGIVTGVYKGTAVITCTVKTPSKTYKLTSNVTIRKPAKEFTIKNKVSALNLGQKYNLNRTLKPLSSNDKTKWSTSDASIAKPNKKGKFTALKEGTVTITGETLSGEKDEVIIKVVDEAGTVTTQEELDELIGSGAALITIQTEDEVTFTIPEGDYSNQSLVVDAPNADIVNSGVFKSVEIKQIKPNTWYEQAIGNILNVTAPNARIKVESSATASIHVNSDDTNLTLINDGTIEELAMNANASVSIAGNSTDSIPVVANAEGATITTSIPLTLTCNQRINLVVLPGAESTVVHVASEEFIPVITGNASITVIVGTGENAQTRTVEPTVLTPDKSGYVPTNPTTPTNPTEPIPVVKGLIAGRVTAVSGGSIAVTGSAITTTPEAVSGGSIIVGATVRVLRYEGDITDAINSIFANSNTIVANTNEHGYYTVSDLDAGNYVVVISKEGYKVLVQLTTVTDGSATVINGELIELTADQSLLNGFATGNLFDALTGSVVDSNLEFTYEVYENFNSTSTLVATQVVTGSAFSLELAEGYYTVRVIDNRDAVVGTTYATTTSNIVVLGGTTFSNQDIVLSTLKEAGQATFVLTWGEFPRDLDSHLIGPVEGENNYHIYYGNKTYPETISVDDIANLDLRLDLDDITSYGPETTSIYNPVEGGIYTFYVHNYSGNDDGALVNSNAKVVVTTVAGTYTFEVPTNGTEELSWVVCTYNSTTGEVTPINQLYAGNYYYDNY